MAKIEYFIRTKKSFETQTEAIRWMNYHRYYDQMDIGYYKPQPKYKRWVPLWLINLITVQ